MRLVFLFSTNGQIYENRFKFNDKGEIIYHPFEKLYYWDVEKKPRNFNEFTFSSDDLYNSLLFSNVNDFSIEFDGENDNEQYREAWADISRGEILKNLMRKEVSWYIGFRSLNPIQLIKNEKSIIIPECLEDYLKSKDTNQIGILNSKKPYCYDGLGEVNRLFIEVTKAEVEWVVTKIWPDAMEVYTIEGYCFESGKMAQLIQWNDQPRNENLFREILNKVDILFYTYPAEHSHFQFFTTKYQFSAFREMIDIDNFN